MVEILKLLIDRFNKRTIVEHERFGFCLCRMRVNLVNVVKVEPIKTIDNVINFSFLVVFRVFQYKCTHHIINILFCSLLYSLSHDVLFENCPC